MCRFIETICFKNGEYQNLLLHQNRVHRTFDQFFSDKEKINITSYLPDLQGNQKVKVRVIYSDKVEEVTSDVYEKKNIEKLVLVDGGKINYSYKYQDRSYINALLKPINPFEEIVIIKNGRLTDSSYANLALWDGEHWYTPNTPLLSGIKRQHLVQRGEILVSDIRLEDLQKFRKVSLINALLDLDEIAIDIANIQ